MNGLPGARRIRRRTASGLWSLMMNFDLPDLAAASQPGLVLVDNGYGTTLTAVPGRFGEGAAVAMAMGLDWSACPGFADAAALHPYAYTLEMWVRSPSGAHAHWLATPGYNYQASAIGSAWTHIALCRNGIADPGALWIGGAQIIGVSVAATPDRAQLNYYTPADAQYDALRLTIGAALYTAPFTPPTAPP